ncbi:MAG: hypothetical protein ABI867_12055 [Kofleriaceae bacterium]
MRAFWLLALVACSEHGETPPVADSGPFPDTDDRCQGDLRMQGELVDIDSSASRFLGISDARISLSSPRLSATTGPNGEIDLCVPATMETMQFDVDGPDTFFDGPLVIERGALQSFRPLSIRAFTTARVTSFYAERGLTFDTSKGQVLVFVAGDISNIDLDVAHGAAQAANETTPGSVVWATGDAGRYVLFPNVDATLGKARITGSTFTEVPIAPGQITLAAVAFFFI